MDEYVTGFYDGLYAIPLVSDSSLVLNFSDIFTSLFIYKVAFVQRIYTIDQSWGFLSKWDPDKSIWTDLEESKSYQNISCFLQDRMDESWNNEIKCMGQKGMRNHTKSLHGASTGRYTALLRINRAPRFHSSGNQDGSALFMRGCLSCGSTMSLESVLVMLCLVTYIYSAWGTWKLGEHHACIIQARNACSLFMLWSTNVN